MTTSRAPRAALLVAATLGVLLLLAAPAFAGVPVAAEDGEDGGMSPALWIGIGVALFAGVLGVPAALRYGKKDRDKRDEG